MIDFEEYIKDLQSEHIDNTTEHSKRSALEILLKQFADQCQNGNNVINILQEPKRKENYGSPDFKVYTISSTIGYVENKKITENLDNILKTDQIKKYRELSKNIILTNYIEFVWIKGDTIQREILCNQSDLENKKFKLDTEKCIKVEKLISFFFSQPPQQIANPKELAIALAYRCKNLKIYLLDELVRQQNEKEEGRLCGLYETFKKNVFHELELTEFADAFAQMLTYGLFLAKLNADIIPINLRNAKEYIPNSFQLIRELVSFLDELERYQYRESKWIIDEIISIMNNIDLAEIQRQLSFTKRFKDSDNFETDPYIYFYETFLKAYDKKLRKAKGVYYTPPQVVNFITRAINDILKNVFNIPSGFASRNNVNVLDFATGTGTFLLDVIKQTLETFPSDCRAKRDSNIKEHILKNFYGFEYLIAPYTIAHLKLSQYLLEQGYTFADNDRLQIFLTNTLEPIHAQLDFLVPQLSKEGEGAQKVKDKPILVITGNPPYSYKSKNNGDWITNLLKGIDSGPKDNKKTIANYYMIDGEKLDEKNTKGLKDDYVKFIRFAQDKIEQVEQGIIGIITNHGFLTNPTFRGMRKSLMNTFDQMYFIDLHGSIEPKETAPDGGIDENVFDIKKGVAISIFIKKKDLEKKIFLCDIYGKKEYKYKQCAETSINNLPFKEISPTTPSYLFKHYVLLSDDGYKKYLSVTEIFSLDSVGIVTSNDKVLLNTKKEELKISVKANFTIDFKTEYTKKYSFGPFDERYIYYDLKLVDRARYKVMQHLEKANIALIASRQTKSEFKHVFVSNKLCAKNFIASAGSLGAGNVFPLYLYQKPKGLFTDSNDPNFVIKTENFTIEFRAFINNKYNTTYTPEQILGYIYAIVHSITYRNKYAEFLKEDFPRIPFTDSVETFETLSTLGWDLIQKHLLIQIPTGAEYDFLGTYKGNGDNVVIKSDYRIIKTDIGDKGSIYINKDQYFDNIPENIYNFYIGGYQVLDKYLKDRKNLALTIDEFENVENVVKVLAYTIKQMEQIDTETKEWI